MMVRLVAFVIAAFWLAPHAISQSVGASHAAHVPFGVGERLEYEIGYGPFTRGSADLQVDDLDTVRGRSAWHAEFNVRGGVPFFRVNDHSETWIDTHSLASLRYKQDNHEGSRERHRLYNFFPDNRMTVAGETDTLETVERPVDDVSILYFIRTIALPVGLDTSFSNYFLPDRNPIRIRVLGREHITVPGGEFDAIVIQPIIKTKGIFSEGGEAKVWLSDDDNHIILQVKSKVPYLPLGSLNMFLKSYRPPPPRPPANKP